MADQIALRVAETQVSAGSAVSVYAAFRDRATAAADAPTTIRYRVDCLTTGRNVVNWTSATAAATAQFDVSGLQNEIIARDNDYEVRQLTVEADTNLDTQVRGSITWRVRNIRTYEHTAQFQAVDFTRYEPFFPITNAEQAAGLVEEQLRTQYPPGDIRRYGTNSEPGTTDMTAAIERAQAQYAAGGPPVVFESGERYYHGTVFSFTGETVDWRSDGEDQAVIYTDAAPSSHQAFFSGSSVLDTTVATDAFPLDLEIELASVTGVQAGDLVKFVNTNAPWQSDDRGAAFEGQLAKIAAINGSTVTLDATLSVGLPAGVAARIYRPIRVRMRGIRFEREAVNGSSRGIVLKWADDPQLENCSVINARRIGLHLLYCYKGKVEGGEYSGANLIVSEQIGYGVLVESCFATHVKGIVSRECRRGLDFSGYDDDGIPAQFCKVSDSRFYGGGFAEDGSDIWPLDFEPSGGAGSHGPALGCIYDNNEFHDCYFGLSLRGRDETARNNLFVGAFAAPIWVHHGGGLVIENNRYTDKYEEGTATPGTTVDTVSMSRRPDAFLHYVTGSFDTDKHLTVRGNIARNVKESLIHMQVTTQDDVIANWIICDNVVGIDAGAPGIVGVVIGDDLVVPVNFSAWNNEVIAPSSYTVSKYDITGAPDTADAEARKIAEQTYQLWIPDDKAARIRVGRRAGQIGCTLYRNSANLTPRFKGFLRHESITFQDWGGSSGVTVASVALEGTTGTDGNTTIAFAGDSVYVENRSGGALQLVLVLEGAA